MSIIGNICWVLTNGQTKETQSFYDNFTTVSSGQGSFGEGEKLGQGFGGG